MAGGIIQLVAQGVEDMFLTSKPQITFFKTVYRRYTNFSMEPIAQYFTQDIDFSKKATCPISKNADLIKDIYLVITLPIIQFNDNITQFAWTKRIGFAIINYIEIEIGGQSIDKHYGEWLNIWFELTQNKLNGISKMIGDVPILTNFTFKKDLYTLYIPLQFWFCKSYGLSLPLVSMCYSQVNINLQLNDFNKCYITSPTNYIQLDTDIVNFEKYEYIEQIINNNLVSAGIFNYFDVVTKRLYYTPITSIPFQSVIVDIMLPIQTKKSQLYLSSNSNYYIYGKKSNFKVMPLYNSTVLTYSYKKLINVSIPSCYLLVNYIYLDTDERLKFSQTKHEYIIEQIRFCGSKVLQSVNNNIPINIMYPTKLLVWFVQLNYLNMANGINDSFNYTTESSYSYNNNKSLVQSQNIIFNGINRIDTMDSAYFNNVQSYQYFKYPCPLGANLYSFCLYPNEIYPSGTCGASYFDSANINLSLNKIVTIANPATFTCYAINYNIFRVIDGLAGIVFS